MASALSEHGTRVFYNPSSAMASSAARESSEVPVQAVPSFYRPELDCLRFFAFFGVFIFHTAPPDAAYYAAHHIPLGEVMAAAARGAL